jgi:hypothetical protein
LNRSHLLLASLLSLPGLALAQNPTPAAPDPTTQITLGQSVFPLYGPWKFTIGDSPLDPSTHQPLWASPAFDDSHWETVTLNSDTSVIDPVGGYAGYTPGWTARNHPGYSGYAWYRIRVRVTGDPNTKFALLGPTDVDDAFQVFANDVHLGDFGNFSGSRPSFFFTQPTHFSLPPLAGTTSNDGTQLLAFRVWMDKTTLTQAQSGGFHTAPLLGEAGAIATAYQVRWIEVFRLSAIQIAECILFLLLAILAFSLILFDRSDRVYLWMGCVFVVSSAHFGLQAFDSSHQIIPALTDRFITSILSTIMQASWVMIWWVWFRLQRPAWLPRATAAVALIMIAGFILLRPPFATHIPLTLRVGIGHILDFSDLSLEVFMLLIAVLGIRKQGFDGWIVLPAQLLIGIAGYRPLLTLFGLAHSWFPFGMQVSTFEFAYLLLVAVLFALLLRRLMLSMRSQRALALDVKQAQEVQRVILPDTIVSHPGLIISSEYRPTRDVGGDFFQIIPSGADGSLLVVAGDVSGKGLQAGMLVALLIGAIRSTAELNPNPLFLLEALNRRLLGRQSAQATCLALRISVAGDVILANAGHLPPYLNGSPLPMEGALPLGLAPDAEFSVMHFHLDPDDKLILLSDGIAEATDPDGKLVGFDRVQQLLQDHISLTALADAAQRFGQQDDISLISLTRTA